MLPSAFSLPPFIWLSLIHIAFLCFQVLPTRGVNASFRQNVFNIKSLSSNYYLAIYLFISNNGPDFGSEAGCHWIASAWREGTPQWCPVRSGHHTTNDATVPQPRCVKTESKHDRQGPE